MSDTGFAQIHPAGTPIELGPSPRRWRRTLALSVVFLGFGVLILTTGGSGTIGVLATVFGGLGVILAGAMLAFGRRLARLRVDATGVHQRMWWRDYDIPWNEVESFYALTIGSRSNRLVGIEARPDTELWDSQHRSRLSELAGHRGALGTTYGGMSAEELADYLNVWVAWSRTGGAAAG